MGIISLDYWGGGNPLMRLRATAGRRSARRWAGLSPALPLFVLTVAASAGDIKLTPTLEVSEEYATNVDIETDSEKDSAFVTRLTPGVRVRVSSARVDAALNGSAGLRHQTDGDDRGRNLDLDLSASSETEFVRNLFFVEADASVSRQVLSSDLANSEANQELVQNYRLSPFFTPRFGSTAAGELRYQLDHIILAGDAASNDTTHALSGELNNGPSFRRFRWFANGRGSRSIRPDDGDISRGDIDLSGEYAVTRWLHLLAGAGYQTFDDGTAASFDSPKWHAGLRLRPGPRSEIEATVGERDDAISPAVSLRYDITARTRLTASYEESLSTSQQRLSDTLAAIALDTDSDDFVDQRLDKPFNPRADPFDIDDGTERIRTLRARIRGDWGRNTVGLSGSYSVEEKEPAGTREENMRADLEWGRQLRRNMRLDTSAGYERIEFDDGQTDDEYLANARLTYKIRENAQAFVAYFFRTQTSTEPASEFTDHRVTIGMRLEF